MSAVLDLQFHQDRLAVLHRIRDVERELTALRMGLAKMDADHERGRFPATYCSQCGGEFGPGEHGYSSCAEHHA